MLIKNRIKYWNEAQNRLLNWCKIVLSALGQRWRLQIVCRFFFSSPEGIEELWRADEEKGKMLKYVPSSIDQVNTLLYASLRPIKLVVYERPYSFDPIKIYLSSLYKQKRPRFCDAPKIQALTRWWVYKIEILSRCELKCSLKNE